MRSVSAVIHARGRLLLMVIHRGAGLFNMSRCAFGLLNDDQLVKWVRST